MHEVMGKLAMAVVAKILVRVCLRFLIRFRVWGVGGY